MNYPLMSDRGIPLVFTNEWPESEQYTVTIEFYVKWYALFLVNGKTEFLKVGFDVLDPFAGSESAYVDHVPNPKAVKAYAEANGYLVDELAYELMVGRWMTEVKGAR